MDLYFKFKLYGGLFIIGLLVLIAVITILRIVISCMKETRKENYLASIGFEKKMWRVASIGNHCDYRYILLHRQDLFRHLKFLKM